MLVRRIFLFFCVFWVVAGSPAQAREETPIPQKYAPDLISSGTGARLKATAGPDTFCLFGGPGSLVGKFQDAGGNPDPQGWIGEDVTEQPIFWQRSTFNAENLDNEGPGNHAMWAGQTAAQQPGWATPPGYGNSWNTILEFRVPMVDPSVGQTVSLDFTFNHESEPIYDFLAVNYLASGMAPQTLLLDGTNQDGSGNFPAPGEKYSTHATGSITYASNGYSDGDIRIQIAAQSDGGWSDEDGEFSTVAGLVQVDNIQVDWHDGVSPQSSFEDFEGPGPYEWTAVKPPFAGQFGRVFDNLEDIDPCRENDSPAWAFVDDGLGPYNPSYTGTGTGGFVDLNWNYGPGGYSFPATGGITNWLLNVSNNVISPPFAWDLPGTADNGAEMQGATLRFDVWEHLPLSNGIFYTWGVRAETGGLWSDWANTSFVYYDEDPNWTTVEFDMSGLFPSPPDNVQVRLSALEACFPFGFNCGFSTPAPYFDNVSVLKHRIAGPVIIASEDRLLQDSFPNSGNLDLGNLADLSCRIDMARDISSGSNIIPGDSTAVSITSVLPGSIARAELKWVLDANPLFAAVRSQPAGTTVSAGTGTNGEDQWFGTVTGDLVTNVHYAFDLPHDGPANLNAPWHPNEPAMFFPGDRLRYYFEAEDDGGRISTLPFDISGFNDGVDYDPVFTVRALPGVSPAGEFPPVLYVAAGLASDRADGLAALEQLLLSKDHPPNRFDTYTVLGPEWRLSNTIGTPNTGGATVAQLANYDCIVYDVGQLSVGFNNGTTGTYLSKADEFSLLQGWRDLPGNRRTVYMGSGVASAMRNSTTGVSYLWNEMGVDYQSRDLVGELGTSMFQVTPAALGFSASFDLEMNCVSGFTLDAIEPGVGAAAHQFSLPTTRVPSVVWSRSVAGVSLVDITLAFPLSAVRDPAGLDHQLTRRLLLGDVLSPHIGAVGNPPQLEAAGIGAVTNHPNPFNPSTQIRFSVGRAAEYTVKLYNSRGERVRQLWSGALAGGPHSMEWDGRDDRGVAVASGAYVAEIQGDGHRQVRKLAVLK